MNHDHGEVQHGAISPFLGYNTSGAIGIDKPPGFGVIVSALQIIKPRFGIVGVADLKVAGGIALILYRIFITPVKGRIFRGRRAKKIADQTASDLFVVLKAFRG